jgi:hypothetical protein
MARKKRKSQKPGYIDDKGGSSTFLKNTLRKIGAGFAVILFLAIGFGVPYVFIGPSIENAWASRDIWFFLGALAVVSMSAVSVLVSREAFIKGLPYHALGLVGFFFVGNYLSIFESLRSVGATIYLASWVIFFVFDTVFLAISKQKNINL